MQSDRPLWLCVGASHPCPGGTGIVSTPVPKELLMMAGIHDYYTSAPDAQLLCYTQVKAWTGFLHTVEHGGRVVRFT